MKKSLILCVVFFAGALGLASSASAQPSDKFTGSLLWRISGGDLSQPSYILGTHHLNGQETFDIIPGAQAALESSTQVVGEMVLSDMAGLATQIQLASIMPDGITYRSLLSSGDYERLDSSLRSLIGVGMEQLGAFKPGALSLTVSQLMFMQAYPEFNAAAHVAMDQIVQTWASEHGHPVVGLETVEDQIAVLMDSEPLKVQAEELVCALAHTDYYVGSLKRLSALYAAGDLAGMYSDALLDPANPCPASEEYKFALVKGRNDKWLARLPELFSAAPTFVAVGALHLAGEEGLLFQLDRLGYTVEAVK